MRSALYDEAIAELALQGRVYPCDCSRSEVARAASAPHAGEEIPYRGTYATRIRLGDSRGRPR